MIGYHYKTCYCPVLFFYGHIVDKLILCAMTTYCYWCEWFLNNNYTNFTLLQLQQSNDNNIILKEKRQHLHCIF